MIDFKNDPETVTLEDGKYILRCKNGKLYLSRYGEEFTPIDTTKLMVAWFYETAKLQGTYDGK